MGSLERIYQIDQILGAQRVVTSAALMERLGVSLATLKRDLTYMKDRLHAPIRYDRSVNGYRYDDAEKRIGPQFDLPGMWFSAEEIHALLTMQHLLANLDSGGLLGPHIQPLLSRLSGLLGTGDGSAEEIQKRIHIETVGAREFQLDHFQIIGSALIRRKRLIIRYHARGTDEVTEREVSPQRLVHYRDNWYLDAWCHMRHDLRAFAVDAIKLAQLLDLKAKDIDDQRMNDMVKSGYGIFSGDHVTWATLLFTPERARWVAAERWHPLQTGQVREDGSYLLRVPYTDDRELIMDILKYGADCQVLEPLSLVDKALVQVEQMQRNYFGNKTEQLTM
ncbi:MAG: YafY family transcriptional regulator [Sulfuritalea sp.]|nr:YafY family transcriptional regulator [Sulfuritalea sp.]